MTALMSFMVIPARVRACREAGTLAVGMMAVSHAWDRDDPQKPTVESLRAIRMLLDRASDTEQAIGDYERFLEAYPDTPPESDDARDRIEALRE